MERRTYSTWLWSLSSVGSALALNACGLDVEQLTKDQRATSEPSVVVEELGDGCVRTTKTFAPVWACDEEQLRVAENGFETEPSTAGVVGGELQVSSCDAVADLRREILRKGNHDYLNQSYRDALTQSCFETKETSYSLNGESVSFCGPCNGYDCGVLFGSTASGGTSSYLPIGEGDSGAKEYSTTNNQVAGVEEADYVKNDAGHIYLLHAGSLHVFDAWPVATAKELATVSFASSPKRLLLEGDRLVVFLQTGVGSNEWGGDPCTYGYDCRSQAEPGGTEVQVFDVSDSSAPKLLKNYEFPSGYVASRRMGNQVFLVTNFNGAAVPIFQGLSIDFSEAATSAEARLLAAKYSDTVDAIAANLGREKLLPKVGSEGDGCGDALVALGSSGSTLTILSAFDLETLGEAKSTFVSAPVGFVYASADALYMSVDQGDVYDPATDSSLIHKFSLGQGTPSYRGSATVKGHVLNQFAMDEREGVLRVATTAGHVPAPETNSIVSTLHEVGGRFKKWGELSGIAPAEDIRSVRFDGDRAFVVTFKKTDPLFTIGLAEPSKPTILGELKIPGFSTYMHPLDKDHLLAVGYNADDMGDFAFFNGIQIQVFDVSDLKNPKLLHKKTLGTRGTTSEALTDHLAFTYFAPKKTLALPVTVCEGGGNGAYGDQMTFSGVIAYEIDIANGISETGRLPFEEPTQDEFDYSSYGGCMNWWTSSSSNVKRTLFLDDYLFGISGSSMRAASLAELSTPIVTLELPEESSSAPAPWK